MNYSYDDKDTERFNKKVKKLKSGCWKWTACKTIKGYGRFQLNGQNRLCTLSGVLHGQRCARYVVRC